LNFEARRRKSEEQEKMLRPSHEFLRARRASEPAVPPAPTGFHTTYTYIGRGRVHSGVAGVLIDQIFDKPMRGF
jgi:hypothetical protein